MSDAVLCLASASPRRRELLWQIGVAHCAESAELDEAILAGETAESYVERLAKAKAACIAADPARSAGLPVLGADTTVVLDGVMLGKPCDADEALAMLARLSAREHRVLSGVALLAAGRPVAACVAQTRVRFRAIAPAEARAYWATGEPRDKAGGYAIQGFGAAFVERIEGSYSAVMGLPLFETAALLAKAGVPLWRSADRRAAS